MGGRGPTRQFPRVSIGREAEPSGVGAHCGSIMATKTRLSRFRAPVALGLLGTALALGSGCGRGDTRVNSDPGPGRPTHADTGQKTLPPAPTATSPATATAPTTGTDSTGRPGEASGGTVGGGAGSNTSGTTTEKPKSSSGK